MGHRLVEHTADIAIEAQGADLGEALGHAAAGLVEVVTGHGVGHTGQEEIAFTLEAPDEESLVVAFLSELLWILEGQGVLWTGGGARVEAGGPGWRVHARGNGIAYDRVVHGTGVEVKAVTYHGLRVERGAKGTRFTVILDI